MRSIISQLLAVGPELALFILTSPILKAYAATPSTAPSPNLDLSQLGRVAFGGDFDSISLYTYQGQSETAFSTNGSQALLTRYPDGAFQSLALADANIQALCPFIANNTLQGVVVGGNFTSLGGVQAQGIALYDPNTTSITPLPGLSGKVSAVYCDASASMVYVGGTFTGANSTNAIAWTTGWTNLPFAGFNGPVTSITKSASGHIIFGGQFDGVGNTTMPKLRDAQVINLGSGNITSSGTTGTAGFNDPRNIVCKVGSQDGSNNTWLLNDRSTGYWQGTYSFGFNPTKLRLYNTQYQGRGTRTFYFVDLDTGGILNMTYRDTNGQQASCSNRCPLAQNGTSYQDFGFSPSVGMNGFRLQIIEWYGDGAGLAGIELFQDDIYSFAVNDFNEPQCDGVSSGTSTATVTGNWSRIFANGQSSSDYLRTTINNTSNETDSRIVFMPDLRQSGNYTITMYTPGCVPDGTCNTRGQVNITGTMTTGGPPVSAVLYQNNYYDKYDQIYYGYVDVDSSNFRPSVTLTPVANQNAPLTVVAQRIRFELMTTSGGLNGLFEYDPNQATINNDFSTSAINSAAAKLSSSAMINVVASYDSRLIVAGNFSGSGMLNIMSIGSNATSLSGGGLNEPVSCAYQNGSTIYMGGNFTASADNSVTGLNGIAVYNAANNSWSALGAGVNGTVSSVDPIALNITSGVQETCIALSGRFSAVNAFNGNSSFNAAGFAVWVPSHNNWLQNLPNVGIVVVGKLSSTTEVPGFSPLYGGMLSIQQLGQNGAVELIGSGQPTLQSLGVQIQASTRSSTSVSRKRALGTGSSINTTGVYDTLFYSNSGLNITVLGGSFGAQASNGSTVENLVFINNTASQTVTGVSGLDLSSIIISLDYVGTQLFAGGLISGNIAGNAANGLAVVDLTTGTFVSPHPPALSGTNVIVNAVAAQPSSSVVYVGGQFSSAGSLPCPSLCYYDTNARQWNSPATGLSGTISSLVWTSNTQLVLGGNFSIGGNTTTTMATYDSQGLKYTEFTGASSLPGPVQAITAGDTQYSTWFVAGTRSNNGTTYLAKYQNNAWTIIPGVGAASSIRGLQILALTSNHADTDLVPASEALLLTGNIILPSYGNASAVLFNGTDYSPLALTTKNSGGTGSISGIFVSNPSALMQSSSGGNLAFGYVILISFFIALVCTALTLIIILLLELWHKKREWHARNDFSRSRNLERVPPEALLQRMGYSDTPKL